MENKESWSNAKVAAPIVVALVLVAAALGVAYLQSNSGGSSVSATSSSNPATSASPFESTCTLWNYPPVLNSTYQLTNSTLLQSGDIVGLNLGPYAALYYGFIPSQDVRVTGEIQTQAPVPITVEILGGNGSTITQPSYNQTGNDVSFDVSLHAGSAYRLVLENARDQSVTLTAAQSFVVLYPGC